MPDSKPKLHDFSNNVYSQFGEDGIIAKIFEFIQPKSKVCVEFGAWEGFYHSNTANLWTHGWKGVLIEGDLGKFEKLGPNTAQYGCICIHAMVQPTGDDSIDAILKRQGISEVDLLSIDIDGNDYYIFENLDGIRPRVVICEYNPTIPKHLELVAVKDNFFGCSSLALTKLAERKGYRLLAITDTNCIFVDEKEFPAFSSFETDHDRIALEQHLTYLISGYDGRYALSKEPTYGYTRPFTDKLAQGNLRYVKQTGLPKAILKKIYYSPAAASLKMAFSVVKWFLGGKKGPPPHYIKARTILDLRKKFGLTALVETGTYLGQTVAATKNKFKEVHSIEISEKLYQRAKKVFQKDENVHLYLGDSATTLPQVISRLDQPTLFWLDGHYSGGITEKGDKETPIMKELEAIFSSPRKGNVVLVDDARCFVGKNDYPTMDELRKQVLRFLPDASIQVKYDMIIIEDKKA